MARKILFHRSCYLTDTTTAILYISIYINDIYAGIAYVK
jgi:hypothetical protein